MSQQAREALVASANTFFQHDSQRTDLRDSHRTRTELIALLTELCITKGWAVEFTAIRADHHDDSSLGLHSHSNGYCVDLWPLKAKKAGRYLDASDPKFKAFLRDAASSGWIYQIGLAGSADVPANRAAAGTTAFSDGGADHVHFGAI